MSVGLRVENIKKVYDKNIALNGVSLDIRPGEFVCLLGPSGCGKSSLLRIIAGLDRPDEGSVYINDRNVTRLPPQRRNFGIMFQSYALFPNLTAFENVAYGLRNKKIKTRDADERVNRLFEMIKCKKQTAGADVGRRAAESGSRPRSRYRTGFSLIR